MQNTINRNLLQYAVQRAITCPRCQQILDMRKVVIATLTIPAAVMSPGCHTAAGPRATTRDYTLCTACWYNVRLAMFDIAREAQGTLEVLDAREVFPPSLSEAKRILRAIGITLKYDPHFSEYNVNFTKGGTEDTCYFTGSLMDAIGTGRMMAASKEVK